MFIAFVDIVLVGSVKVRDVYRVSKLHGLPFVNLVNEQGRFIEAVKPWAGMFVLSLTLDPERKAQNEGS